MANNIPLSTLSNGAGGYLLPQEFGDTLIDGIQRESAVAQLARVDRLGSKTRKYATYAGRPTVSVVGEGDEKTATGAEFSEITLNVKKLAAIVIYTDEMLEDAREDPRRFVNADLVAAFAQKVDALALGYEAGTAIVSDFDSELAESSQTHELGTGGDAFAVAVSACLADIEGNGYRPNGLIAASDIRGHLRDARRTVETADSVYTDGFNREPGGIYGLPIRYSSNLDALPAGAGKKAAVVGDFSHAILGIRKDLTLSVTDTATINVGGTQHNLWQRNEVAVRFEMRAGFVAHDLDRAFSVVTNAS